MKPKPDSKKTSTRTFTNLLLYIKSSTGFPLLHSSNFPLQKFSIVISSRTPAWASIRQKPNLIPHPDVASKSLFFFFWHSGPRRWGPYRGRTCLRWSPSSRASSILATLPTRRPTVNKDHHDNDLNEDSRFFPRKSEQSRVAFREQVHPVEDVRAEAGWTSRTSGQSSVCRWAKLRGAIWATAFLATVVFLRPDSLTRSGMRPSEELPSYNLPHREHIYTHLSDNSHTGMRIPEYA